MELKHINELIKPRDVWQFIRTCYLINKWMISNEKFDSYISRIRKQVIENWYTENDLTEIINEWKKLALEQEWLTINFK